MSVPRLAAGALALLALAAGGAAGLAYLDYRDDPLVEIVHLPRADVPRSDDFSANVNGLRKGPVRRLSYRLNDGPWRTLAPVSPRNLPDQFTLELPTPELRRGSNRLRLRATARLRPPQELERSFRYAPEPVRLPTTVRWDGPLDVQDGLWESFRAGGEWWVRPRPGSEGYDRILTVAGPHAGGRRVETEVVYRHHVLDREGLRGAREFAFGVLSLWGGHPDDWRHVPRRGWRFALGWWWSKPGGVGNEISSKVGDGEAVWVQSYRSQELEPGRRYRLVVEVREQRDARGRHLGYRQRLRFHAADRAPERPWLELDGSDGVGLPARDYAVALLAFNCQVEFGPVRITPLEPLVRDEAEAP